MRFMLTNRQFAFLLVAVMMLPLLSIGCAPKLSFEKQYTLQPGEILSLPVDPIAQEQTIKVSATSSDGKIACHIYLEDDELEAEKAITFGQASSTILAGVESTLQANLQASIPANQSAIARLTTAENKTATVTVKITN